MPALATRGDLQSIARAYLLAHATRIDPSAVDLLGSDANIFVGSTAQVGAHLIAQIAAQFGAHFLETAEGDDLDRYVRDHHGEFRKGAAPAVATVVWSRPNANAGAGFVPVGTRVAAQGAEYVLTSQATFSASGLTASSDARAVQAGREFQVGRNQLTRAVQPQLLFDPSLRPNNPEPAAGGEPREDDDALRERVRRIVRNARRGTLGAIETGATTVPGVASALAVETYGPIFATIGGSAIAQIPVATPARAVILYVADSSGVANAALARAAGRQLGEWRAAGIQVVVLAGLPTIVPVRLRLSFSAGTDTSALSELIRRAVVEYVNTLPVGVTLERAALLALLRRYRPYGLLTGEGALIEPAGDVVPEPGRTLRTSLDQVTTDG